jgi:membrane associated rhomboid family serine protease
VKGANVIPLSDSPPRRSFPLITVLLIIANVVVFVYELGLGNRQLDAFMMSVGTIPAEILTGRDIPPPAPGPVWITLFTAMFVHGGFLHIGSNMLYLWVFGDNIEDAFGHIPYLVFYVACGVAAGLTHVFINAGSTIPSVGASGAIAGVLGSYLLLYPRAQVRTLLFLGPLVTFPRISAIFLIGFWFVTQLLAGLASLGATTEQTSGVAVWAHIGGFVAGMLLTLVLRPRRSSEQSAAW